MNIEEDIIQQSLEEYLKKDTSDMSLYFGKMGELLLYGLCSNKKQSVINTTLHLIIDALPSISKFNFSEGLTGIGFGLQYLSDLNILPVDSRKVFQYLDDKIYFDIANNKSTDLSLLSNKSVLARTIYLYFRLKSSSEPNYYRKLAAKECLTLLITEIKELISIVIANKDKLFVKRPEFYLEIGQCFCLLHLLLQLDINKNYCQDLLLFIRDFISHCFEDKNVWNDFNSPFLLRLLYFYTYVSFEIKDKYMKECAIKWVQNFEPFTRGAIKSDLDFCFLNQLNDMIKSNVNFSYRNRTISDIDSFDFSKYVIPIFKQNMCDKILLEITI